MTAEKLRRAAKRLRETIGALDPWDGSDDSIGTWEDEFKSDSGNGTDAAYVRLMNPDVGLALADLLESLAFDREANGEIDGRTWDRDIVPLADLILGGAS